MLTARMVPEVGTNYPILINNLEVFWRSDGVAHFSGTAVGDEAYRVDRFASRACGNPDRLPGPRQRLGCADVPGTVRDAAVAWHPLRNVLLVGTSLGAVVAVTPAGEQQVVVDTLASILESLTVTA